MNCVVKMRKTENLVFLLLLISFFRSFSVVELMNDHENDQKMIMKMSRQSLSDRQGNELLVETSLLYLNGLRNSLSSDGFRIWTIVEMSVYIFTKMGVLNNWSSSRSRLQLFPKILKIVHDRRKQAQVETTDFPGSTFTLNDHSISNWEVRWTVDCYKFFLPSVKHSMKRVSDFHDLGPSFRVMIIPFQTLNSSLIFKHFGRKIDPP